MEFSHVGGVTWLICRFRQTLPEAFHHSLKCRQIVSGKNYPTGSLSQHITSRIENKGACKRSRHKCKAVKLPPNQHKMFFWSFGEGARDRGPSGVREASWLFFPSGESKGKGGQGAITQLGVGGQDLGKANRVPGAWPEKHSNNTLRVLVGGIGMTLCVFKAGKLVPKCASEWGGRHRCMKIQTWCEICSDFILNGLY